MDELLAGVSGSGEEERRGSGMVRLLPLREGMVSMRYDSEMLSWFFLACLRGGKMELTFELVMRWLAERGVPLLCPW